ncbi:MAG: Hpt domain-containing protein [Phycisphaerales bacterium]|nr:Hpt domain-containing protein [Phycisphaerales bacterium]MCI0676347.1 Hpt domain-containing protein [Phycisphaerales bacterium]
MAPRESGNHRRSIAPVANDRAGNSEMAELAEFFISELQDRVQALDHAWHAGDQASLRTMSQQLKDAAQGFGYPAITESAAQLEAALLAEQAEISAIGEKVEALIALCRRATAGQS